MRSMLLVKDEEDWDVLLPHIMHTIRSSPPKQTGEMTNFMMLGWETKMPEHLMYIPAAGQITSRERYSAELACRMGTAHDKLVAQQLQLRTRDRQEELSFKAGQLVWLKTKQFLKWQSHKLQSRYAGPYESKEEARNHTYIVKQNDCLSRETESRLMAYNSAKNPAGRILTLVELNRQLERKASYPPKANENTWLVQRNEDKTTDYILKQSLENRNTNKRRSADEITQSKHKHDENIMEL